MRNTIIKTKPFLYSYLIFAIISIAILILFQKPDIQIFINKQNTPFFDFFFKNTTHLGHGILLGIIFLIVIFINKKHALTTVLSSIFMSVIVFVVKTSVNAKRPLAYFTHVYETDYNFHFVEGVNVHSHASFPSGHTATAFTTFFLLTLFLKDKNKIWQILFFTLALLVGYSRMYLMQHFLEDVVVGAFIGIVCVFFSDYLSNILLKNKKNKSNEIRS